MNQLFRFIASGLFILTIAWSTCIHAQSTHFDWAITAGGTGNEFGAAVAIDSAGNTFVTGGAEGSVYFDGLSSSFMIFSGGNQRHPYLMRLNDDGNLNWAVQFPSTGHSEGKALVLHPSGNLIMGGDFRVTLDLDPSSLDSLILTSAGFTDGFIASYTQHSTLNWGKQITSNGPIHISDLAVASSGEIYVSGYFNAKTDFDPGLDTFYVSPTSGTEVFLLKLSAQGDFIWVRNYPGWYFNLHVPIHAGPGDNVTLAVSYDRWIFPDPLGDTTWNNSPDDNFMVATITANGTLNKTMFIESDVHAYPRGIAVSGSGDIYTVGRFRGKADFDPGQDSFLIEAPSQNIFVLKLDSTGAFVWARVMSGNTSEGSAITLSDMGHLIITGNFVGTVDFDPGPDSLLKTSTGGTNTYIAILDSEGHLVDVAHLRGTNNSRGIDVAVNSAGSIATTGYFSGTYDFDPGPDSSMVTSRGSWDIFLHRMQVCFLDMSVTQAGPTLSAHASGADYQWVDCNNNFEPIPGETGQSFTATANGSYAVVVIKGSCADTSECMMVTGVGIDAAGDRTKISVYPNPVSDVINLVSDRVLTDARLTVTDLQGRIVYAEIGLEGNRFSIPIAHLPPGIYLLELQAENTSLRAKLMKE